MEKNTIFDDEIIFFDAEILDDDDDAPVGTLLKMPVEAPADVAPVEVTPEIVDETPAPADTTPVVADEVVDDIPVIEDTPTPQTTPVEVPAPAPKPKKAPAKKVAPAPQPVSAPSTGHISLNDSFDKKSMDMSFDYAVEMPAEPAPKKKAPAKPKTTPVKKEVTEADIWGTATIKPAKKAEPVKEEVKPEPVPEKKAPAKKAEPKTTAPKKETTQKVAPAPEAPTPADTTPAPVKKTRKKAEPKPDANNVEINKTNEEENKVAKEAKEVKEQIIVEGTGQYHGKFVIKKTDKGHFVYKLFAYGNKCVAIGAQAYESLGGVKGGIASVQRIAATAPIENQTLKSYETLKFPKWEIYADKKGEFRLRLYASNGNLVATTNDGYTTVGAAKKGIESVGHAAEGASIVRNDDLW